MKSTLKYPDMIDDIYSKVKRSFLNLELLWP